MLSEVFSFISILLLVAYVFTLQKKVNTLQEQLFNDLKSNRNAELETTITHLFETGKSQAQVIKFVRSKTNLDLIRAKLYVDEVIKR